MTDSERRKTRVLFVSHLASRGGAQKCLAMLCQWMDRDRFEVHAILPGEGDLSEDLRSVGVAVRTLPLRWWVGVESRQNWMREQFRNGLRRRVRAISSLLERERIDLVLTNSSVTIEGALAAAQVGIPHVYHLLEMMSRDPVLRPIYPLERFYWILDRLSAKVVVPSTSVEEEVRQYCSDASSKVIHTGIDRLERDTFRRSARDLFGFPKAGQVVCFVGELWARKGVQSLVRAAPLVLANHPDTHFVIVGHDRGELEPATRLARDSGIGEQIHFLGERSDALTIIASSDLLVLPSLSDPFPVVVLEAMALGLPAVVTRSGGAAEMQVDGETGFVVEPGAISELAEAIGRLLADGSLASRMGRAGQERARREYSLEQYAREFEGLFLAATSSREPAGADLARSAAEFVRKTNRRQAVASARLLCREGARALRGRLKRLLSSPGGKRN